MRIKSGYQRLRQAKAWRKTPIFVMPFGQGEAPMTVQRAFCMSIVLTLLLVARLSHAQVLTGTLFGTINDESGAVLPEASVRLRSLALIGGQVSTVSNEKGQFRFVSLPAGEYTLEVEQAGFAVYHEDHIPINVQGTFERTVLLKVGGIAESISVQAGTTVDQQRSGVASRF